MFFIEFSLESNAYCGYNVQMEKEESRRREKELNPLTRVNIEQLSSDRLRERVRLFEDDAATVREISRTIRTILDHRDGTFFEDLAFIDSIRHKSCINTDYDFYDADKAISACKPNKPMKDLLAEAGRGVIIAVHNHPQSAMLSLDDINRFAERGYKYAIVVCHNGMIFRYEVTDNYNPKHGYAVFAQLEKLRRALYNKDDEQMKSALNNLGQKGVIVEVIS